MLTSSSIDAGAITVANWLDDGCVGRSLQQVDELLPTATVRSGTAAPRPLITSATEALDEGFERFWADTAADAVIVIRNEEILLERYFGTMTPDTRHLLMSVSKSVCGLVAGISIDQCVLSPARYTSDYVPELKHGPYGNATVRELLDMTAALEFDMTHASSDSTVNLEDRATGWRSRRDGDPQDSHGFLQGLKTISRPHGAQFQYCSATTEVLAWVLERASGISYPRLVSELLWSKIGVEHDAYFTVDGSGTAYACAGMGATLRDLARLGCVVLAGGAFGVEQVIPESWVAEIHAGGDRSKIAPHMFATICPRGSYRNQWWVTGDLQGSVYAAGLCSQYLWINPTTETVVAKFSSQPVGLEGRAQHVVALSRLSNLGVQ